MSGYFEDGPNDLVTCGKCNTRPAIIGTSLCRPCRASLATAAGPDIQASSAPPPLALTGDTAKAYSRLASSAIALREAQREVEVRAAEFRSALEQWSALVAP